LECNYLTRIPDLGLSVITFSNRYYEPEENRDIVDFLLDPAGEKGDVQFPTEPVSIAVEELARDLIQIDVAGGTLELGLPWDRFTLVPVGVGAFSWHNNWGKDSWGMMLEFSDTIRDGPLELVIRYDDGHSAEKYVRLEEWTPSLALYSARPVRITAPISTTPGR
jgi:hypothetical protein